MAAQVEGESRLTDEDHPLLRLILTFQPSLDLSHEILD